MTEPQVQDLSSSSDGVGLLENGQNKGQKRHAQDNLVDCEAKRRKTDKGVITDKEFSTIAEKLNGDEWTNLALKLGFEVPEIQDLIADNKESKLFTIVTMLRKWRQKTQVIGSRMKLAEQLKAIGKDGLARCVADMTKPNASEKIPDFEFEEMLLYIEENFPPNVLNRAKRLLNVYSNTIDNPEKLVRHLRESPLLLRRTNVCCLQSLLIKLKCNDLYRRVEDYGKNNDYVVHLFESSLLPDVDFTRVKFKLKCSPEQLSKDEVDDLVEEIKNFYHITFDCVVNGVEKGCTCITLDIPKENVNAIRDAVLYDPTTLCELGIFKVNIDGEDYPDLCYCDHNYPIISSPDIEPETYNDICPEVCHQSTTDMVIDLPPRGAVIKTAIRNALTMKYKELNYMQPNMGNSMNYTLTDNYIEIELTERQNGKSVKPTEFLDRETRKVLIEGIAGSGKTTFCKKLVHDWATSRNVVFGNKIPFFLRVNEISSDKVCQEEIVERAIFPKLLPTIFNSNLIQDDIWHYIKSNSGEFIFILDGLDEASDEVLTALDGFLNGEYLSFSTIIATTTSENLESNVQFDSHFMLPGFSEAEIKEYVKVFFKNRPTEEECFVKEFNNSNFVGLMKCPLFSVIICLMWQEASYRKIHDSVPLTQTDLLSQFCMFLLRRYDRKENGRKSAHFDTFQNVPQNYIDVMTNTGKAALSALTTKSTIFQLNPEDGMLAERIGLITQSTRTASLKVIPSYIAVHNIILNFLAAFYLKSTSESYPVVLLMSNQMKMVTRFLTGLLDADNKSYDLLKLFVENSVQNYTLTATCLEDCKNKVEVLEKLGKIVSKHTYLELGGTRKESTDVLECVHSMLKLIKPPNIMIMKIEAPELFLKTDKSAVTFAKLIKRFPKLIALNFPRFMSSSQFCSIINELKRGSSKRRCVSLEKLSIVADFQDVEVSEMVVEMLMMFQKLNDLVLQVKMNTLASTRFLRAVSRHTCKKGFLEHVQVLDISQLTVTRDKISENIVNIFSELKRLERIIVPYQVLKLFYPRYYRTFAYGKYVLHKMQPLSNVKLSVFLQIDVGRCTNNPKSAACLEPYTPLSVSYVPVETFSVPEFSLASPTTKTVSHKNSKAACCELIETTQGVIVLSYWDDVLSHQRALDRDKIRKLVPSAVCLHSYSSVNSPKVTDIVNKLMADKAILNDASCTSLATFSSSVNMNMIEAADLTECSLVEKVAAALLKFPNIETINLDEKLNPVSLLQELEEDSEKQMKLKFLDLNCSSKSFEILKSVSIHFNDVVVTSNSIILMQLAPSSPAFKNVHIKLGKDPSMLINLLWVKRIRFDEGGNCKFLRNVATLLDRSAECFKDLDSIDFMAETDVDEKEKCVLEDIKSKIHCLQTGYKKHEGATLPNDSRSEHCNLEERNTPEGLLTFQDKQYKNIAFIEKTAVDENAKYVLEDIKSESPCLQTGYMNHECANLPPDSRPEHYNLGAENIPKGVLTFQEEQYKNIAFMEQTAVDEKEKYVLEYITPESPCLQIGFMKHECANLPIDSRHEQCNFEERNTPEGLNSFQDQRYKNTTFMEETAVEENSKYVLGDITPEGHCLQTGYMKHECTNLPIYSRPEHYNLEERNTPEGLNSFQDEQYKNNTFMEETAVEENSKYVLGDITPEGHCLQTGYMKHECTNLPIYSRPEHYNLEERNSPRGLLTFQDEQYKNIAFIEETDVDEKAKDVLEDITEIACQQTGYMKHECTNLSIGSRPGHYGNEWLLPFEDEQYKNMACELKSVWNLYDEVCLSPSRLRLTSLTDINTHVNRQIDLPSFPRLLVDLPQIKKLTIQPLPTKDQMYFLERWARALWKDGVCYVNLHTLDLKGTKFKSKREVNTLLSIIAYTPNLSVIENAKVLSRVQSYFNKFLLEKEIKLDNKSKYTIL
ncbi:uncharacterized protein [Antedon mediterranea]|uniref:uncharacterized protein n=1 Tax=Antedon mediterranea TaxID=105859 RepID=UPI003AF9AEE6